MPRGKTPRTKRLKRAKKRGASSVAGTLSSSDVIDNLVRLFDDMGLDSSKLRASAPTKSSSRSVAPVPYPLHLEIGKLLAAWHQDHRYLDQTGNPLPIKRSGSCPSFGDLSSKVSPELNSKVLLSHLKKIGAVKVDQQKRIHVQMRSIPVYLDKSLAIEYTLSALNGFVRTLRHNISCDPSNSHQLFHRIASSAHFDPKEIPALKVRIKRYGQNFLESCDNWMIRRSKAKGKAGRRHGKSAQVSVGVYLAVDGG